MSYIAMEVSITDHKFITSALLIAVALLIRWFVIYQLNKQDFRDDDGNHRWINSAKNATNLIILIGLVLVWITELRFVALSIATFVVALVIATREFIQCFLGSLYQASTRSFIVGDWIQIGDNSGKVVSTDWLSTRLLEIDMATSSYQVTGKTLLIPNNQFIVHPIKNLNHLRKFIPHTISIIREADTVNVFDFKAALLKKAAEYCHKFEELSKHYNHVNSKKDRREHNDHHPSVRISTTALGKNQFDLTVYCPPHEAVSLEQKLTKYFMTLWYQAHKKTKTNGPKNDDESASSTLDNH
ncbi:mechanosensitive ion channel family protein [Dasania marina]|uniref:mechanosensitive ion channel family protein n=1 Tax=Dasania marina TaxID=471499 RepID=UPI00036ADA94|nr:mechanosensitive ion channel family protein [Dasania marina]